MSTGAPARHGMEVVGGLAMDGQIDAAHLVLGRDDGYRWVSVEIGRRVAAQVEKGLSVDQIVAIAKALEVEPHSAVG